jgi:TonB family protein
MQRHVLVAGVIALSVIGCSREVPPPAADTSHTVVPPSSSSTREAEPPPRGRRPPYDFRYRIPPSAQAERDQGMRNPDVPPVRLSGEDPEYPEVARKARITGVVLVEIVIEKDGRVSHATVLKPLPFGLDQAAAEAVLNWKYKPGLHHGRAVRTIRRVTIPFPPRVVEEVRQELSNEIPVTRV